jgi:Ser/Thr protein kinase RdoA (MazF antagonist)
MGSEPVADAASASRPAGAGRGSGTTSESNTSESNTSESTAAAVVAAAGLAARLGLDPTIEPVILRDGANLTVRLSPHPVVARIATQTAAVRDVEAYQIRELTALHHLAATGAPAIRPARSIPPGPHEADGWRLVFLQYHDHDPDRPLSGRQVGDSLAAVHRAIAGLDIELPSFVEALDEVPRLLQCAGTMAAGDRAFLNDRADRVAEALRGYRGRTQPLHGDVHLGNLLRTPNGPIWADFEEMCTGPVEWDLASLVASTQINTAGSDLTGEAVRRYGCDTTTALWRACLEGNVLMFTAWAAVAAARSERAARSMPRRLAWHRRYARPAA